MQAGVGEYVVTFGKLQHWGGSEVVGFCHRAGSIVGTEPDAPLQVGPGGSKTHLIHGCRDALFYFLVRISG